MAEDTAKLVLNAGVVEPSESEGVGRSVSEQLEHSHGMPERSNRQIVDVSRILEQARTAGGDPSKLVASVSKVVSEQGGLGAIVEKLKSSGLGDKVESWVGTSENQPAESDAVADAIGHEHVARIATETGLPEDQAERGLASVLPELINQSTPEGRVPSDGGGGALSSLMASVGQKMG